MTIKEIKEEVLTKFVLLDTYAKWKNYEFPAGKVVFDATRGFAVRQVSPNYKLITTEDLVRKIKERFSIKFLGFYKTPASETVYIQAYIPTRKYLDALGREFYVSFELANSYSSRFLPSIYLNLYYPNFPSHIIRTDMRVTGKSREKLLESFDFEKVNLIIGFAQDPTLYSNLLQELRKELLAYLPYRLWNIAKQFINATAYPTAPLSYLTLVANIAKVWEDTAWELARNFQIKQYTLLTNKIKES